MTPVPVLRYGKCFIDFQTNKYAIAPLLSVDGRGAFFFFPPNGGQEMTGIQKQKIKYMRAQGFSYKAISDELKISVNTVKSYCRRNALASESVVGLETSADICANCKKELIHTPGAKKKRFCTDKCRMTWWAKHPDEIRRKALYNFVCPVCKKAFTAYGNAKRKYCSRECYGIARSVYNE